MAQSLIREPNWNVVLRSDNVALRFFQQHGGALHEVWSEPFPLLTNSFPGSAVDINWQTGGQDPTRQSANGYLTNPICIFGSVASQVFNYWGREFIFDAGGTYGVCGFAPDFWLSSEPVDDAPCSDPSKPDHGWRTTYAPGAFGSYLVWTGRPIIFEATTGNLSGIFGVGDETKSVSLPWAQRMRSYEQGRIAFRTNVSLRNAGNNAVAGFMYRKDVPSWALDEDDVYWANGNHLMFNSAGGWEHRIKVGGTEQVSVAGVLTPAQKADLLSNSGLAVEVRTHNVAREHIEIWIGGVHAATTNDYANQNGAHFFLYAACQQPGYWVMFQNRHVVDLGHEYQAIWKALPDGKFRSTLTVRRPGGLDPNLQRMFTRANLPGAFMNGVTFLPGNRRTMINGNDAVGIVPIQIGTELWAGNNELTAGLHATILGLTVDDSYLSGAHALLDPHGVNDEFVMHINPLPVGGRVASRFEVTIEWRTKV